jgi:hypothetical protein
MNQVQKQIPETICGDKTGCESQGLEQDHSRDGGQQHVQQVELHELSKHPLKS